MGGGEEEEGRRRGGGGEEEGRRRRGGGEDEGRMRGGGREEEGESEIMKPHTVVQKQSCYLQLLP